MFSISRCRTASSKRSRPCPESPRSQGEIVTLLETELSMSFGMPAMITGSDMRGMGLESFEITLLPGQRA